jgi:hypothetical protein
MEVDQCFQIGRTLRIGDDHLEQECKREESTGGLRGEVWFRTRIYVVRYVVLITTDVSESTLVGVNISCTLNKRGHV